jgi:hypothetical protein
MTTPNSGSPIRRREFLARWNGVTLASFAVATLSADLLAIEPAPQERRGFPNPPPPADPDDQDKNAKPGVDPQTAKRVMAAKNEKEFREGVEKLYQMATELRDELAQAPKMNVLSVRMYKKTEEIEKLAKQLKGKAKGG